ncbi:hypothetical protein TcWFU_010222 [Taenia crassiceps]|uniref:Uncharacterized protein n=1 Tax=Taenia crassiceps TaxID=6207 RepID=A0ABR4Q475_9CEST
MVRSEILPRSQPPHPAKFEKTSRRRTTSNPQLRVVECIPSLPPCNRPKKRGGARNELLQNPHNTHPTAAMGRDRLETSANIYTLTTTAQLVQVDAFKVSQQHGGGGLLTTPNGSQSCHFISLCHDLHSASLAGSGNMRAVAMQFAVFESPSVLRNPSPRSPCVRPKSIPIPVSPAISPPTHPPTIPLAYLFFFFFFFYPPSNYYCNHRAQSQTQSKPLTTAQLSPPLVSSLSPVSVS